jgi:ABC-2 type transport system ATP-binding protein
MLTSEGEGPADREIVRVHHLARIFRVPRPITAVDDVSFSVRRGEIFGLLGPNGAGKTTLFRMLTTLLKPSSGSASIDGLEVGSESDRIRGIIGVCPQTMTLDPEMTAWENLDFYGELLNLEPEAREKRIKDLLEVSGLTRWANVPVRTFSRGMMRKLEIVRAFIHEPRILFLDEPTMGLDPDSRRRIWNQVRSLHDRGVTVVLTTHYMDEAAKLCDRIAFMNWGRILAIGSPESLVRSTFPGKILEVDAGPVPGPVARDLLALPGLRIVGRPERVSVFSVEDPNPLLPEIQKILSGHGINGTRFSVRQPVLEDVFIALAGGEEEAGRRKDAGVEAETREGGGA